MTSNSELFGQILEYPDSGAARRFGALIGIDDLKQRIVTEGAILLDPSVLYGWSESHYGESIPAVALVANRTPLLVFAGDVGTGKTELAESVGDPIARSLKLDSIQLFPLSLSARGRGLVGEMTTLIVQAFDYVRSTLGQSRIKGGQLRHAAILLVDEADALAQSRELEQMHHEDRAGVNALIRSIDDLRREGLPVLTIMCTNRPNAIDPAIVRRAAHVFTFERPNLEQCRQVLVQSLNGTGLENQAVSHAAEILSANGSSQWGATYSDLQQRFLPDLVLSAYENDCPLTKELVLDMASRFVPTRPFGPNND